VEYLKNFQNPDFSAAVTLLFSSLRYGEINLPFFLIFISFSYTHTHTHTHTHTRARAHRSW